MRSSGTSVRIHSDSGLRRETRRPALGVLDEALAVRHALEHAGHILLVAADAIERLRQHYLEAAAQRIREQRLDAGQISEAPKTARSW